MLFFAISIFLSAFLLFQVQPMIGKLLLPWFGGTPTVWSTVMLFFQVVLTGGYAYASWLVRRMPPSRQSRVHLGLIGFAILLLFLLSFIWESPITPDLSWRPADVNSPTLDIFRLLVASVGLPYFILASNGPLMQSWFSRLFPDVSYARLYALSNFGSLLGLLAYPIAVEPVLSLRLQGWFWSTAFIVFGLLVAWIAVQGRRGAPHVQPKTDHAFGGGNGIADEMSVAEERPSPATAALWIVLSATASVFLLSVTNQISQEVAVIPFLWVLPLALYLLSFILAFSGERGYPRKLYALLFLISTVLTFLVMLNAPALHASWQILTYCLLLFAACMLCHGELYLLRPAAQHLTNFYLMVSIGGALGGIFVSLIAPLIFNGYWEFFVGLGMAAALLLTVVRPNQGSGTRVRFILTTFILVTVMLAILDTYASGALFSTRNFYGVIRVRGIIPEGSGRRAYVMSHGITEHGLQFIEPELREMPTTYYTPQAGAGLAILNHAKYGREPMHIGLLGLGVGTLASYAQPGDRYRLYEINPAVVELAEGHGNYFTYLHDSQAEITTVLGDARISLEDELARGEAHNFDILVLDTFSSDSIPIHLVTREAFALYLSHLAPGGIIAAHITNLHLELQPVFWQLAQHYGLSIVRVEYPGDSNGGYASHWVLLAREAASLDIPAIRERSMDLSGYSTDVRLWTDDYSNLFQILK